MSQIADFDAETPFVSQGDYSQDAVALMRAMRELRGQNGTVESSPLLVLQTLKSLGYSRQCDFNLSETDEARLFELAMQRFSRNQNVTYPTCENVLHVVQQLGYQNATADILFSDGGMPIDRRRREVDTRNQTTERRSSLDLGPQELLDLTDEEHQMLDSLKDLRDRTGRGFASSEELLSIAWRLGYRPVDDDGAVGTWLEEDDRCRLQVAFTTAIETELRERNDGELLTCRTLLEVIRQIGLIRSEV